MSVPTESVDVEPHWLYLTDVRLVRNANGRWTLLFQIHGDVPVDRNREVMVQREVRVGGLPQLGRKKKGVVDDGDE